jgi:hypothetical protein
MATTRHAFQFGAARLERSRQSTVKDVELLERNIEELEERIAPAIKPPVLP